MATVISVSLQKGGTGKTTTALNLASYLGFFNKKVLLIDMDYQANATNASDVPGIEYTITDVFAGDCTIEKAIIKCPLNDLLAADVYLANFNQIENIEAALLKNILAPIQTQYDYIIIDTPPLLGNLLKNALYASNYVIIPMDARPFSLQGLDGLHSTIKSVQELNKSLHILGILLVKYNDRSILSRQIKDLLNEKAAEMQTNLFKTIIREGIAVAEAQALRQDLVNYAGSSKPSQDYKSFAQELLNILEV